MIPSILRTYVTPFSDGMALFAMNRYARKQEKSMMNPSRSKNGFFMSIFPLRIPRPVTSPIFAILLPIVVPITTPPMLAVSAWREAKILVASSGRFVPIPTIVSPIKKSDTPKWLAIFAEYSTNQSELFTRITSPVMKNTNASIMAPSFWRWLVSLYSDKIFKS